MPVRDCGMPAMILLAVALMASSPKASAQTAPGIIGSYRISAHHSPEGDPHLFLLRDSAYVVAYFGGADAGRWTVVSDTLVYLTPTDRPALPFALYGRHHKGLPGRTRIFYTGIFSAGLAYVGLGARSATGARIVRRVYNEEANCISYSVADTFKNTPDSIFFTAQNAGDPARPQGDVYAFPNPEGFNDFVAVSYEESMESAGRKVAEPFAAIRRGGLYIFDTRYFSTTGKLPGRGEDSTFLSMLTRQDPDPDTLLYSPNYSAALLSDDDGLPFDLKTYKLLPGGDAMVAPDYIEGEEYFEDSALADTRVLYRFRAMRPVVDRGARYEVEKGSVFRFVCE